MAKNWYQHLSLSSINNFTQFIAVFKFKFIIYIPLKELSTDFQKIRQDESKSLKNFISHFNNEVIQIKDLKHEIACKVLKKKTRKFVWYILSEYWIISILFLHVKKITQNIILIFEVVYLFCSQGVGCSSLTITNSIGNLYSKLSDSHNNNNNN